MTDRPESVVDLQDLIRNEVQESLHLDYKRSLAIDNSQRAEIAKDISAFANSDGGLIIYGMEEKEHLPVKIDQGVDHTRYSREWLEQVINSGIAPRIDGVQITQIPLSDERSVYAVQVPKSYRGPHQASDKRYYKRFNFQLVPMEHYEIEDVRNRRQVLPPLLNVDVDIRHGVVTYLVIENIGEFPAQDVQFRFAQPVVWPGKAGLPPLLARGAKVIPAGRIYRFLYRSYPEIINDENVPPTIDIEVSYVHPQAGQRVTDSFHIDFRDYLGTAVIETELYEHAKALEKAINELAKEIRDISRRK